MSPFVQRHVKQFFTMTFQGNHPVLGGHYYISSKRLEGLRVKLTNQKYNGTVLDRTHIQNIGWESGHHSAGSLSGTTNRPLRHEALQRSLTGEMAQHYGIYYRIRARNCG